MLSDKMRSLLTAICIRVALLCLWTFGLAAVYMLIQGADPYFPLDENYTMAGYPGLIFRTKSLSDENVPPYVEFSGNSSIIAIAVLDNFIVGRTKSSEWFAIDRHTHKVWFPYSSQQQLQAAIHVEVPDSRLYTSFPWKLWNGYERIKVPFAIYIVLCAATLEAIS